MEPSTPKHVVGECFWKWLPGTKATGLERFELIERASGWLLRGTILTLAANQGAEVRYQVSCDSLWRTEGATVEVATRARTHRIEIEVRDGSWFVGGREREGVRGCIDIDLGWSPSTNTLPIRRLGLDKPERSGDSGPLTMAWVRFPELTVEPLPQAYQRLGPRAFRYISRQGAFVADLEVDELGLVTEYQGFWKRIDAPA